MTKRKTQLFSPIPQRDRGSWVAVVSVGAGTATVACARLDTPTARIHKTLRVTQAMEAGVTDHVWTIDEMLSNIAR